MVRLFVGLDLPEAARLRLSMLCGGVPGAAWVPPENFHVTLRFIGKVAEDTVADIDHVLRAIQVPVFSLSLAGIGTFGSGQKRHALWVGVENSPVLQRLHDKVDQAMVCIGLGANDRKFLPHVTLAHLKAAPVTRVYDFVTQYNLLRFGPLTVERFILFSSHLGHAGPTYAVETDYPLLEEDARA